MRCCSCRHPAEIAGVASLLGSGHRQVRNDRDDDEWADWRATRAAQPPRIWDNGQGRSAFLTAGITYEDRQGGTMPGGVLAATGLPYEEALDTRRYDVGGTAQALIDGRYVLTVRASAAWQHYDHQFGDITEQDERESIFSELALRGARGAHTWVAGVAYERDDYNPRDVPRFAYTYDVLGVFLQDDVDLASWVSVSAGARVDVHSDMARSSVRAWRHCSAVARGPAACLPDRGSLPPRR